MYIVLALAALAVITIAWVAWTEQQGDKLEYKPEIVKASPSATQKPEPDNVAPPADSVPPIPSKVAEAPVPAPPAPASVPEMAVPVAAPPAPPANTVIPTSPSISPARVALFAPEPVKPAVPASTPTTPMQAGESQPKMATLIPRPVAPAAPKYSDAEISRFVIDYYNSHTDPADFLSDEVKKFQDGKSLSKEGIVNEEVKYHQRCTGISNQVEGVLAVTSESPTTYLVKATLIHTATPNSKREEQKRRIKEHLTLKHESTGLKISHINTLSNELMNSSPKAKPVKPSSVKQEIEEFVRAYLQAGSPPGGATRQLPFLAAKLDRYFSKHGILSMGPGDTVEADLKKFDDDYSTHKLELMEIISAESDGPDRWRVKYKFSKELVPGAYGIEHSSGHAVDEIIIIRTNEGRLLIKSIRRL
jgi:hypothetical protein